MRIQWWLHRTLIIVSMPVCALAGVILGLYAMDHLDGVLGSVTIILIPLGFFLGAFIPHRIFRTCIIRVNMRSKIFQETFIQLLTFKDLTPIDNVEAISLWFSSQLLLCIGVLRIVDRK